MNLADDLNAVIIMVASCTSQGLLLLFYINIETLPIGFEGLPVNRLKEHLEEVGGDHRIGWSYILLSPLYLGE